MSVSRAAAAGAALAVSGLAVFGLQGSAVAAPSPTPTKSNCPNPVGQYPPGQCGTSGGGRHTISDTTPQPGKSVHVHSEGWKGNSDVTIEAHSAVVDLGTFRANAAGVLDANVTIPLGLPVGAHLIVLNGIAPDGTPRSTSIPIAITAANAAAAQGASTTGSSVVPLPTTGAEIASVAGIGIVLVGAGAAALASGRRRRSSTSA